jgi:hypothetical protein
MYETQKNEPTFDCYSTPKRTSWLLPLLAPLLSGSHHEAERKSLLLLLQNLLLAPAPSPQNSLSFL